MVFVTTPAGKLPLYTDACVCRPGLRDVFQFLINYYDFKIFLNRLVLAVVLPIDSNSSSSSSSSSGISSSNNSSLGTTSYMLLMRGQ